MGNLIPWYLITFRCFLKPVDSLCWLFDKDREFSYCLRSDVSIIYGMKYFGEVLSVVR